VSTVRGLKGNLKYGKYSKRLGKKLKYGKYSKRLGKKLKRTLTGLR
jgi:hypothetical protein